MVDLKKPPYFSTFDEAKKYYRILARPGRPIQAREWNDLQEQIQKQIERVGAHLFENGAQVLPGTDVAVTYRNNIGFIKLTKATSPTTEEAIKNRWMGKTIVSTSGSLGVKAKVIGYRVSDFLQEVRLFVDYLEADTDTGSATEFVPGQDLQTDEPNGFSAVISSATTAVGRVSGVFIQNSVYFFNGDFILVDEQSVFLDPSTPEVQLAWKNTPTAKVGLAVERSITTFDQDEDLGDNASPSDSYGAPGADRLSIVATLVAKDYNTQNDGNFIELVRVSDGVVRERVRNTAYSVLEDTMARRTYDESGDYTVKDFPLTVRSYLKEGDNNGVHTIDEFRFDTATEAEDASEILFGVRGAVNDVSVGFTDKWLPSPANTYEGFLEAARSKLSLQIDPGKAYVKGYEIEKIAPSFVDINKARELRFQNNRTVNTNLGAFVYVTNVYGAPEIEKYESLEIHRKRKSGNSDLNPGAKIGTAKVLAVEYYSGTHGDLSAVYKLYLFDINADAGFDLSQMKSLTSASGLSFSADLVLQFAPLEGSVAVGTPDTTLSGNGTSFVNKSAQALSPFDYVRVGSNDSQIYQIATVDSDIALTLSSSAAFSGNQAVEFAYAALEGLQDARGLVFMLPESHAYTLRGANSDNSINDTAIETTFSVRKQYSPTSNGSGVITISTILENEEFVPYSPNDYIVINTDSGDWLRLSSGASYDVANSTAGVSVSSNQVTIYTNANNANFYVIATVRKVKGTASKEKIKTLVDTSIVTNDSQSDLGVVDLGKADVVKIKRITMSTDFVSAPGDSSLDITDRYELDSGQRDYYYGIGSVYLKPGAERPTGRLKIEFQYFDHSSQGFYFSVDSYKSIEYADIPTFTDSAGRVFQLRDCIDFRPRLASAGAFENVIDVPRSEIRIDFHHYLNRIDNLYLDRFGNFGVVKGAADVFPVAPEEPSDSMSLYELDLQAYTATPNDCFKRKKETRRYTMRDIGKIESRVANLEYYTLLTLLEKEAKELDIKDAQGLDRFKNGFIVDNFTSHGVGEVFDKDYRCSVDEDNEELRPSHCQKHVSLIEKNALLSDGINDARQTNNYMLTGKLFTLPYEPSKFIEQELASQVENVNPYAKFTFKGRITLDPATDTWRDTNTLPSITVYDDTAYRAAQAGINPNQVIWGEWEKNWVKKDVSKTKLPKREVLGPNRPDAQHSHNWPRYVHYPSKVTTTVTTQNIRRGLSETVVAKGYKTESLGKRVVSIVAVDFMRGREIKVTAQGFLPNSALYPFFDGVAVAQYCKPEGKELGEQIQADETGTAQFTFNLPGGKFNTGERIFRLTNSEKNQTNPQPATEGETRYEATGWIDNIQETELAIRQFEKVQIERVDTQILKDVDTKTAEKVVKEDPIAQSFAVLEKGGCFLLAVDVFFFSKDAKIPIKLQIRPLSNDGYPTNLIMPFGEIVKPAEDVVINEVDLDTGKLTVTGNTANGIAGYTVGPWSPTTANPIKVQRVTNKSGRTINNSESVAISSAGAHEDMIPTRFVFKSPVFLQENNDYAIVLLSDSVEYQAWVSQAGPITTRPGGVPTFGRDTNTIIGTTTPILKDTYINGVFFRSSNGTTWNSDQLVDLKFALHKAQFKTNVKGVVEFVNDALPVVALANDAIITKAGSRRVRVLHKDHGHPAVFSTSTPAPRVVIKGATSVNGISESLLNRDEGWTVESVELDSYVIEITDSPVATSSGRCGGNAITATEHVSMDTMFFHANALTFPKTEAFWTCSTTNGGNVSYSNPRAIPFVENSFAEVKENETNYFGNQMTISSSINENNELSTPPGPSKAGDRTAGGKKSLKLKLVMSTVNENLSPVFDADRIAVTAISNRINNPAGSGSYNINDAIDLLDIVPTTLSPAVATTANLIKFYDDENGTNAGKIETTNADVAQHLSKLDVGKLVTISGAAGTNRNKTNVKVLSVSYTPNDSVKCQVVFDTTFGGGDSTDSGIVSIKQKDNFVDEIAPQGGSCAFKYITKQLTLARQSTALKISFDANRQISSDIEVYYKIARTDSKVPFEDLNWVKAEFNLQQGTSLVPTYPKESVLDSEFTEYSAIINGLPPFLGCAIKLVGRGGNSSKPPRISNLKAIALDE